MYTLNAHPRGPNFTPFCSMTYRFQDTSLSKIGNARNDRLSKTAGLKLKDNVSDVYGNIAASGRKGGNRGTSRDAPVTNTVHDTQRKPRCYYCYERGHVNNNCRHGRVVRCHSCGRLGHKEKFCGST